MLDFLESRIKNETRYCTVTLELLVPRAWTWYQHRRPLLALRNILGNDSLGADRRFMYICM